MKRPLEKGICRYVVYTYVPALVDIPSIKDFRCNTIDMRESFKCFACNEPLAKRGLFCHSCLEGRKDLPCVTCTGCKATFFQKSITEYGTEDRTQGKGNYNEYADFQFHQYGDLCLQCRAPFPGEGHFEERHVHDGKEENPKKNPLTEFFLKVLDENSTFIVWEYYKPQVLPCYPKLEARHKKKLWSSLHNDLAGLFNDGGAYMTVAGVEHVYWSEGRIRDFQGFSRFSEYTDIKLDYRFWRPKECKCTQTPCECVCIAAQVNNIRRKLNISVMNYFYKYLVNMTVDSDFYPRFFVIMRDSNPYGNCRNGQHSPQCQRRNAPFKTYQCTMKEEGRCGRCPDCYTVRCVYSV